MYQILPDVLAPNLAVVFCGINPATGAAAAGHSFVNPSNRFWRTLHLAGFTPVRLAPEQDQTLLQYGCGLTTAVARPTQRASELSRAELASAATALEHKIALFAPHTIAFLGKAAYSAIMARDVHWGVQPTRFGGASVWVLPNPSGLNRAFSLDDLVRAYRELRLEVSGNLPRPANS
jgi:TDG/mug DNA glycosylase family protein